MVRQQSATSATGGDDDRRRVQYPRRLVRVGRAVKTADNFAATHGGNAPVLVFVYSGGAFHIDTECVNGSRGNAADHLTKDVAHS